MSLHLTRFPTDISLRSRGGPRRMTDVVTMASGHEQRNQRWANSRRTYDAAYGVKSKADMRAVLTFFEERRGRFHSFLWKDGLDHSSADIGPETSTDQLIGTGDGVATVFQLRKTYGAAHDPYVRPITKPLAETVTVAVDGVELAGSAFSVDPATGLVTLLTPPGSNAVITAGFQFDVHVRFDTDELVVELDGFDSASVPTIPVVEVLS